MPTVGRKNSPGLTLADLNQGKTDYETYCGKCHALKKPQGRTEEQWREIITENGQKERFGHRCQNRKIHLGLHGYDEQTVIYITLYN